MLTKILLLLFVILQDKNSFALDQNKVSFLLYNGNNSVQVTSETAVNFLNLSLPIKIFIHGWKQNGEQDFIKNMATAYFDNKNVNFLAVDWKDIAADPLFFSTYFSISGVGTLTGHFLYQLSKNFENSIPIRDFFANIHILGHSLGAHVAGRASKYLKEIASVLIGRITALDEAGPFFTFPFLIPREFRLTRQDAQFVDLIHTNIYFYGTAFPLGHADFFVNSGGPIQPDCWKNFITMFSGAKNPLYCSHIKSVEYYINTIRDSKNYVGIGRSKQNANKTAQMGENGKLSTRGSYWVTV